MENQTSKEINSWQEIIKNSLKSLEEFNEFATQLGYQLPAAFKHHYPLFIPRGLAKEILKLGPDSLLWKQFIPNQLEDSAIDQFEGLLDPIGDQLKYAAAQIIHRYKNRVLFLPSSLCPVQCRYCFRKNELHQSDLSQNLFLAKIEETTNYLAQHEEIEEIIFTGGDPLILSNNKLKKYLQIFDKINHLKFIRFHTRFPATIPSRIDNEFINLICEFSKRFTFSIVIHTNHLSEWYSDEHKNALTKLAHLPIHLMSQTVLLKDHYAKDLIELFKFLSSHQVKPYYLHHPDKVKGAMHFYRSEEEGLKIYQEIKDALSGWMVPHYVVDSPQASGKIHVQNLTNDQNQVFISH